MQISLVSYSLSNDPATFTEWKNNLIGEIQSCIDSGLSIVLYPELFLMELAKYLNCNPENELEKVAGLISSEVLPSLQMALKGKNFF